MKLLDRYLIRETVPPFLLTLGIFTFLLAIRPVLDYAQSLLAKGVSPPTVGFLLLTLLPQALGVAIPMAFLAGLLMGLGRLSGDREAVALLACGVSPARLLRPLLLLALLAGAANMYVLVKLVPDSNQRFRQETFKLLVKQSEGEIKPGEFYDHFPGKTLRIRARLPGGQWSGVFLADTSQPGRPVVTLADTGYLIADSEKREVAIILPGESVRYVPGQEDGVYDTVRAKDLRFAIPAESVFGDGTILQDRGLAEMTITDLRKEEATKRATGMSPHREIMQRHQMFSFPTACLVFAFLGLSLGMHTRKEGKLGGFALGMAVIFAYYGVMALFEALTKGGHFPAVWARWIPNIVLGVAGVLAFRWRSTSAGRELTLSLPRWWQSKGASTSAAAEGGRPTARVVVVIRVPALRLPRPRLLDLYIGRRYLNVVTLSFFGLLGLYYIGTFIDKSERLFKGQADSWMLARFFYYSTPQFIAYVVPMAILVAVLATIGGLTRTGELVVMRACGVSLYRAAVPLLLLGLVWSGGLFMLDDRVLARANRKAQVIEDTIKGNPPPLEASITGVSWFADASGHIYYYTSFDPVTRHVQGLSVFETTAAPFRLVSHTLAAAATFSEGRWTAERGWIQHFPTAERATRETFTRQVLTLPAPELFPGSHNQQADLLTFGDLRRQIAQLAQSGVNQAESKVTLQGRIAFPLVTVVMTLLGIPFGVTSGRRGALYGMVLAIILGSGYWLVNTFFVAVGQADLLPPALAAWATNLIFLAVAGYLTLTVRT